MNFRTLENGTVLMCVESAKAMNAERFLIESTGVLRRAGGRVMSVDEIDEAPVIAATENFEYGVRLIDYE